MKMFYSFIILILFYFFNLITYQATTTPVEMIDIKKSSDRANGQLDQLTGDSSCRNLLFAISFISVFMYLLSLSLTDFIAREKIPQVCNNHKVDRTNIILSKYLIKIIFGKWSQNLEFKDTFLNFEFNTQDSKQTSSSFNIPTDWLKNLMDFVGTVENPTLKSIKFWVYQPESLGLISTVKLSLKNFKNANSFVYIEAIEVSKVSDDKIQVINIQKNVYFTNGNPKPLTIELTFKQNTKVIPYDGYVPYLGFCDFFYFYIIYLHTCYLAVNFLPINLWKNNDNLIKLLVNSLVNFGFCTFFILMLAFFYLLFIKRYLSTRHNSEIIQVMNIIFLALLWIIIFILNYFGCEFVSNFMAKKLDLFYELGMLQIFFPITLLFLCFMSKIFKHKAIKNMVARVNDLDSGTDSGTRTPSQGLSIVNKQALDGKSSSSKSSKLAAKKSSIAKSIRQTEETPLKRVDSDNSIGSGYYQQMIASTKNVRSISQYGELLRQ